MKGHEALLRYGVAGMAGFVLALLVDVQCMPPPAAAPSAPARRRFDFVEVGTSNFETLIEAAGDGTSVGLSVEALRMYQEQLPDRAGVIKANVAVSDPGPGEHRAAFYYIHPEDIAKHRLPPWLKGCNAVGRPQSEAARILRNRNLTQLMRREEVRVVGMEQLLREHGVGEIGYLKLDVEGEEVKILRSLKRACEVDERWWPRAVLFEHKHLTGEGKKEALGLLHDAGYVVAAMTLGDHRDYTMVRIRGF